MDVYPLLRLRWITSKDLRYAHRTLLSERGVWGRMGTCMCMAELLSHSHETITTLLIGYTPIQNKKLKKEQNRIRSS